MTPARAVFTVAVTTVLALAVVQQSLLMRATGYRLEDLRHQVAEQKAERVVHLAHLSKLRSPQRVLSMVEWLGLGLQPRAIVEAELRGGPAGQMETIITQLNLPEPVDGEDADLPDGVSVAARF